MDLPASRRQDTLVHYSSAMAFFKILLYLNARVSIMIDATGSIDSRPRLGSREWISAVFEVLLDPLLSTHVSFVDSI